MVWENIVIIIQALKGIAKVSFYALSLAGALRCNDVRVAAVIKDHSMVTDKVENARSFDGFVPSNYNE